jgi:1,4-dihydroxy-2-naphthoyl-CoA synthase
MPRGLTAEEADAVLAWFKAGNRPERVAAWQPGTTLDLSTIFKAASQERECVVCGETFEGNPQAKFCSKRCRADAAAAKARAKAREEKEK